MDARAFAALFLLILSGVARGQMSGVDKKDFILYRDESRYAVFPRMV